MFRRVLLCYDGTREGRGALKRGADVVLSMKSEAYLLAICRNFVTTSIPEGVTASLAEGEGGRAEMLLREGIEWLRERGVTASGSIEHGHAVDCIAATAARIDADLIVLGHKVRGPLARWWSESDEESLLERVDCSILVASSDG